MRTTIVTSLNFRVHIVTFRNSQSSNKHRGPKDRQHTCMADKISKMWQTNSCRNYISDSVVIVADEALRPAGHRKLRAGSSATKNVMYETVTRHGLLDAIRFDRQKHQRWLCKCYARPRLLPSAGLAKTRPFSDPRHLFSGARRGVSDSRPRRVLTGE